MPRLSLVAVLAATVLLAACGGSETSPAGSPDNPLVAQPTKPTASGRANEGAGTAEASAGYKKLVERQSSKPASRFTPCNLVTRAQASAILGGPVRAPLEAPQGPTCIYRGQSGKAFVTLSVQSLHIDQLRKRLRARQSLEVADHAAYCGTLGQPILYVALSRKQVLSVAAPCALARQFATRAVARLSG